MGFSQSISDKPKYFAVEYKNSKDLFCVTPMQAHTQGNALRSFNILGVGTMTCIREIDEREYNQLRMESEVRAQGGKG